MLFQENEYKKRDNSFYFIDNKNEFEFVEFYDMFDVYEYEYDEETGRYTRYSKGRMMKDEVTGEKVTTKNIIVTFAENYTLNDGENKGRQDVVTVGSLDGYYITNGKAIKIKCNKESRSAQTQYVDLEGNEIEVNDGNTFVQIVPMGADVKIEPGENEVPEVDLENNIITSQNAIN